MKSNISSTDRTFRFLFGVAIALYILLTLEYEYFVWGLVALFPLVTAILNWCPIQHFLGLRITKTCPGHSVTSSTRY